MRSVLAITASFITLCLASGAVPAAEASGPAPTEQSASPSIASGQRAFIDPATGKLVPRSEAKSTPLPLRGTKNFDLMWIETHPDGTLELHPEGQLKSGVFASIDPQGERHEHCASTPEADGTHAHVHDDDAKVLPERPQ